LPQSGSFQMVGGPDDSWTQTLQKQSIFYSFVPLQDANLYIADQTLYMYMHEQYIQFFTDNFSIKFHVRFFIKDFNIQPLSTPHDKL
jgi:hypothetical protein